MDEMPLGIKIICGYFILLGCLGLLVILLYFSGWSVMGGNIIASLLMFLPAYLLLTKARYALEITVVMLAVFVAFFAIMGPPLTAVILTIIILYLLLSEKVKSYYSDSH